MRIAVLGTGTVGRTLAAAFTVHEHDVVVGTRDVAATMARSAPDAMGNPAYAQWAAEHERIRLVTLLEAGSHGEIVVNATSGSGSLEALASAGDLTGRVLLDVANPLDFSAGFPPTLSVASTDSLGEQLQRAHPGARVVKSLNTVSAPVMVEPSLVPGEHHMFLCGDDGCAKETVRGLLVELGWPSSSLLDLGGIRSSRSTEMYLPLWLSLMGVQGGPLFNIRVVGA